MGKLFYEALYEFATSSIPPVRGLKFGYVKMAVLFHTNQNKSYPHVGRKIVKILRTTKKSHQQYTELYSN